MSNLFKIVCIAFVFVSQGFGAATQSLVRANLLCKSKIIDEIEEAKNIYERLAKSNIKAAESLRIYNRNMGFFEKYIPKITLAQAHELGANPFLATAQSSFKRRLDRATKLFGGYVSHVNLLQFFTNEEETIAAVLTTDSFAAYFQKHKAEIVRGIDLVRLSANSQRYFAQFFDKRGCYQKAIEYYKAVGGHDEIKILERNIVLFGPYAPRVRERDFEDIIIAKVLATQAFITYFNAHQKEVVERLIYASISENSRRVLVEFLEKNNCHDLALDLQVVGGCESEERLSRFNKIRSFFGGYVSQASLRIFLPLEGEFDRDVVIRVLRQPTFVEYFSAHQDEILSLLGCGVNKELVEAFVMFLIDRGYYEAAEKQARYLNIRYSDKDMACLRTWKQLFGDYFYQISLEGSQYSDYKVPLLTRILQQRSFVDYFMAHQEEVFENFNSFASDEDYNLLGVFLEWQKLYELALSHYQKKVNEFTANKVIKYHQNKEKYQFYFPPSMRSQDYFDDGVVSFFYSIYFIKNENSQLFYNYWDELLASKNGDDLRKITEFIVKSSSSYWPEKCVFVAYFNTHSNEIIDAFNNASGVSEDLRGFFGRYLERNGYYEQAYIQYKQLSRKPEKIRTYERNKRQFLFFFPMAATIQNYFDYKSVLHSYLAKFLVPENAQLIHDHWNALLESSNSDDIRRIAKFIVRHASVSVAEESRPFVEYFKAHLTQIIDCFNKMKSLRKKLGVVFAGVLEKHGYYEQAYDQYKQLGYKPEKMLIYEQNAKEFGFYFPASIQPENYFDEDIDIISFYLSNLFVPHRAQTIHDHWSSLLESSNRTKLREIADFIEGYALYLGLEEAHPLVQTSIARLTVLNQNITDPNNPWKVWNDLHRKRGVVVDFNLLVPEHHQGAKLIAGRMVEFRPNALADLQLNVKISGVPDVKPEVLSGALNVIEAKLTPSIRTTISHMSESESFESIHARATAPYITNLLRGESVLAAQLKCLINYALSFPKGPHFNDADQQLIRLFVNIIECEVGQSEGITKLYSNIPEEFKFKILRGTLDADIDVTAAKNHLRGLINETVEELIGNENDFMKIMCGVSKISQISHQSIYLKNFIGDYVGLIWMLKFDHHAQLLYEPMLAKSKAQALALFYDYILTDNRFIQGLAYKINQAVQTKNTYDLLSVLTQSWHVLDDDDGTRQITNQGVVELLMSVGILVPSTSLFAH